MRLASQFLVAILVAMVVPAGSVYGQEEKSDPGEQTAIQLVREGKSLSQEDAAKLEKSLKTQPDDLSARARLLGYYFASNTSKVWGIPGTKGSRRRHILWVIENHPEAEIAGLSAATLDPSGHSMADKKGYEQAKELWLKQTSTYNKNTSVLSNAAKFFQLFDKELSEKMLKRAQMVEPDNSEWSNRLGYLYALAILGIDMLNQNGFPMSFDPTDIQGEFAKKAREELEESPDAELVGNAGGILFTYGSMLYGPLNQKPLDYAEKHLMKAQELAPNDSKYGMVLSGARLMRLESAILLEKKQSEAKKAAKEKLEELEKRGTSRRHNRVYQLINLADAAFEAGETKKAEASARELLEIAPQFPPVYGFAIHRGNMTLGRVALKDGPNGMEREPASSPISLARMARLYKAGPRPT